MGENESKRPISIDEECCSLKEQVEVLKRANNLLDDDCLKLRKENTHLKECIVHMCLERMK